MTPPLVSVVVVSQGRPAALTRCLTGLSRLSYPTFEIVVVADAPGLHAVEAQPDLFGRVKTRAFDGANLSAARNEGIAAAAGEVVAFISDHAVPEPLWLWHLAATFRDPRAAAATGYVLGPNGIDPEWTGQSVTAGHETEPLEMEDDAPALFTAEPGLAIWTHPANMAVRRDVLERLGGFDPAFTSTLGEVDLNLRLAAESGSTALVPLAQVHRGAAPPARRRTERLTEAGASLMILLRKHETAEDIPASAAGARTRARRGLEADLVAGRIEPRDMARLMASFEDGLRQGEAAETKAPAPLEGPSTGVLPYGPAGGARGHRVLSGGTWQATRLREAARQAAASGGGTVTLMLTDLTARPHRVRFDPSGFWEHTGGLFAPTKHSGRAAGPWRRSARVQAEIRRVAPVRGRPEEAP